MINLVMNFTSILFIGWNLMSCYPVLQFSYQMIGKGLLNLVTSPSKTATPM